MKRQSVSHFERRSTQLISRSFGRSVGAKHGGRHAASAALILVGFLSACSAPDPQAIDYKSTNRQRVKAPSLSIPPDIMSEDRTRQSAMTDSGSNASLSGYQPSAGTPIAVETVLPRSQGLRIEGDGSQRWLVVSTVPAAQLWEQIRAFWQEQGYVLTEDSRQRGVMQTDWLESRPKVDQGLIRNTLSIAVNNAYVSAERNRFRTRVENGPNGSTYVFISQQGLHEQLSGLGNENSTWVPKPNDPGLEADFLGRLQRSLAQGPRQSVIDQERPAPEGKTKSKQVRAADVPVIAPVRLPGGVSPIDGGFEMAEGYDQAWARVGAALDRGNFTVDNRDRTRGLYFIRYVDPNNLGTANQGFWNQLFHGKHEKVAQPYQINVRAIAPDDSRVTIQDSNGVIDNSPIAQRIMRLMAGVL